MMRRVVIRAAERFRAACHRNRQAWAGEADDNGRSDLWLSRAEAMSAFIRFIEEGG